MKSGQPTRSQLDKWQKAVEINENLLECFGIASYPPLPTPLLPAAIVMPRTCFHWYLYQHPNLEPHSSHLHSFISGIPILEKFVTHVFRLSHCPANTVHHCTPSSNTPFTGRTSSANTSPHQLLLQHTNPEGSKATFHLHAGPAAKCPAETHHPK